VTLAHVSHWYHSVLYAAPVLVVVVGLWLSGRAAARAEREEAEGPPPPEA
jgi:cytochrome c-type biogenesis protein CcmH/NrfF